MRPSHVIPTVCQWSHDPNIDLDSSFASNQTFNIFHPILHASLLAFNIPYTDLDITSYILVLALSRVEVLYILQSQTQAAYLITGLQEKTTYRPAPF